MSSTERPNSLAITSRPRPQANRPGEHWSSPSSGSDSPNLNDTTSTTHASYPYPNKQQTTPTNVYPYQGVNRLPSIPQGTPFYPPYSAVPYSSAAAAVPYHTTAALPYPAASAVPYSTASTAPYSAASTVPYSAVSTAPYSATSHTNPYQYPSVMNSSASAVPPGLESPSPFDAVKFPSPKPRHKKKAAMAKKPPLSRVSSDGKSRHSSGTSSNSPQSNDALQRQRSILDTPMGEEQDIHDPLMRYNPKEKTTYNDLEREFLR